MNRKKIGMFTIPICAVLIAIGVGSVNFAENELTSNSDDSYTIQNDLIQKAYAVSPNHDMVTIYNATEDGPVPPMSYGAGSGFEIDIIECKIFTKNGAMKVSNCKAIGYLDRGNFLFAFNAISNAASTAVINTFEPQDDIETVEDLFACISETPEYFDACIVEYEVGRLVYAISTDLDNGGYNVPEEYEEKSVELELSIQNDDGTPVPNTKVVVTIEY